MTEAAKRFLRGELPGVEVHPRTEKRPQLFDLNKDPHELKNLAAENPEIVTRMVAQIDGWYPVTRAKTIKVFE